MRNPYPHQVRAAAFLSERDRAALFDEQGLGKTTSALLALDQVWRSVDLRRPALVVAPASVAHNWRKESMTVLPWLRDLDVQVKSASGARLRGDPLIYITTHALMRSARVVEEITRVAPGIVILDEAHYMRTRTAAMTRAFYGMVADLNPMHAWNLTGTPMPNWPVDLFTWLKGYHQRQFPEPFHAFRARYHELAPSDYGDGFRIVGTKNVAELKRRMSDLFLRRKTEQVLDLPELRHESFAVYAPLTPEVANLDTILHDQWTASSDDERMRLLLEDAGMSRFRRWCGLAKVRPIAALLATEIESEPNPKKVVFYHHREVGDALQSALNCRLRIEGSTPSHERPLIVTDFQTMPEHKVILCQLQAASTGITLTASNDLLFAEQSWSPGEMAQAAKRIHRIGQKRRARVRHVFADGTVDELVTRVLLRKAAAVQETLA
jgi:SNF2 family DNA or RNA helicase